MEEENRIENAEAFRMVKEAVDTYQCSGCTIGSDVSCYKRTEGCDILDVSCANHSVGTFVGGIGWVQVGLPSGFDRVSKGKNKIVDFYMFETYEDKEKYFSFDAFNIPVWKYLHNGHTLIRGVSPRTNKLFTICVLEDCIEKFNCLELTTEQVNAMD